MKEINIGDFEGLLNEEFQLTLSNNAGEQKALLIEVAKSQHETPDEHRAPFSLIFKCEPGSVIASGCHSISHENVTLEGVYLEALQPDDNGIYYQAVFS